MKPTTDKNVAGYAKKGPANRKISKRLEARRKDYSEMINQEKGKGENWKRNPDGYHRPGSMQK